MSNYVAKRRKRLGVTAAILAVALLLSCALAAFLYTRTDTGVDNGKVSAGESADENSLLNAQYAYGERRPGDTAPSGSYVMNIASADDLTNFLNSTTYTYGILTQDISISSASMTSTGGEVKPSTNRVLAEGKTLDGNGHTITTYFYESATLECREVQSGLTSDWYKTYFAFQQNGTNTAVDIGGGVSAFGLSNVVSVNRGTIKNLKVSVSAASGRESVAKAIVTAPEGYDGNIGMGVVAGINFGTVENCSSTVNVPYGFYGSPVQANSRNASDSGNKILSKQGMVAVGGVVGINKGNVLNTEVNQNADIGTYKTLYTVRYYYIINRVTGDINNDNIGSGIVGGVAGLNDGGVVNGVSYNATAGSITNKNNHTAKSYTGMIVGLANLQNAKGGASVNYNVGYYSGGAIQSGGSMAIAAGSVQNVRYSVYSGFGATTEAYAYTGTRGGFMENGSGWTEIGSYVGLIGGRVTTSNSITEKIVTGGISFDAAKKSFRAWGSAELNSALAFLDNNMPLLGYGTDGTVTGDHYQNLYVAARLDGQNTVSNESGDFGNDTVFISLAQVGYLWDSYVGSDGNVVSRVLYTVNFDNMPDLAGKSYSVYKQSGSVQGVSGSVTSGSDDYTASSLTDGGRIEWQSGYAPQWTLMLYSLRINDFTSLSHFNAFVKTDKGASNEYFAYAFANAVMLTTTNTLEAPAITGDKVLKSWKTIDGGGNSITVSNASGSVTAGYSSTVGGISLSGISDFVSINEGTIKNLTLNYTTSSRGNISASGSVAYGRVAGINLGTITNVNVNNTGAVADGTPNRLTTTGSTAAIGLAVGANAGTIDTMHTIMWQDVTASATSLAFAGGAVGVNSGGSLRNVVVDGISTATLGATATSGESYVGGVLGAGSNYGSVGAGAMTLTAPSGGSPFGNWIFVGKQTINAQGSYAGMLAGRAAGGATKAENGNSDDYMLNNMVVMMPQTDAATGWFTGTAGRMSLLGRASGTEAASGFVATDLVSGYYIYIDDASASYVSGIYEDYNASRSDAGITAVFRTDVFDGSPAIKSVSAITMQTEYMAADAAAQISFAANTASESQSLFVPAAVGASLSVPVATGNDGNYAPAVKLNYDYDVNLSQAASDGDASSTKSSLEAFMSGDASSVNGKNTHKILAAGANGATLTSDMTLGTTVVADFVKTRGLDGNGFTVTFTPGSVGGTEYDRDGESLVAVGMLASVNRSTISDVNVAVDGSFVTNLGGAYAFGGITGVNLGTVSGSVDFGGTSASFSGNDAFSYVGGAIGVNRGVADGLRVSYDGGSLIADNGGGTRTVLGGAIGLQDSASLSDVQVNGRYATLTVGGSGLVGGVAGIANLGDSETVAGIKAAKTSLSDISNAVYGMTISATGGYKGLVTGALSEGAVTGTLSGVAALYPEEVENYAVPWRTTQTNLLSVYGFGASSALDGILFGIDDYSNDGVAEYFDDRGVSVSADSVSFTFDVAQITALVSHSFTTTYRYYGDDGVLTTDASYTGAPVANGTLYTVSVNGTYANSATYAPVLEVLIDYTVSVGNGENEQLADFMSGAGSSANGSFAGARNAQLAASANFVADSSSAGRRGETSTKGKTLVGAGNNTVTLSGTLPSAEYDGKTVAGGFFAVNSVEISNVNFVISALNATAEAFGTVAGVNTAPLTGVTVTLNGTPYYNGNAFGGAVGINEGEISGMTVNMNGLSASDSGLTSLAFGAIAAVNSAAVTSSVVNLAGSYTVTSDVIYSGAAVGVNYGALDDVKASFADASLTANQTSATSTAYAGGIAGVQNGGSMTNVGTEGGSLSMAVTSGVGYVGGIAGIINTGATTQTVAGQSLEPSSIDAAYAGAYPSRMYGGYRGLVAGAVGSIASGKINGVAAHYYETGENGEFETPWFSDDTSRVSMFGYNTADADTSYATGVLMKVSDYSDDGAADFATGRTLSVSAGGVHTGIEISYFAGAQDLVVSADYVTFAGGARTDKNVAVFDSPQSDMIYDGSAAEILDGGGDSVPVLEFFATYSVNIYSGTESNFSSDGIANSQLYNFIDGKGNDQLYAGAKTGNVMGDLTVNKPSNGYVVMNADKVLNGNGNAINMMNNTVSYVLQLGDRERDNAVSGSGGYEQTTVNGELTGAVGGLIAVGYGTINDLVIRHSTAISQFATALVADAAVGVLVGVNHGTVSGVTYVNTLSSSSSITVSGNSTSVIYGGIVGINAEDGTVSGLDVQKHSQVNVSGATEVLYGGAVGQNYGVASSISVENASRNAIGQVEKGVYGGAVGSNNGTLSDVSVNVGTATAQSDYLSRLSGSPAQMTVDLVANELAIWGGVIGYNAGTVAGATLLANINYGMSAGAGHLSAGSVVGMNDGGALSGLKATGWGGFYVYTSMIMATSSKSVFMGGLVGSMNADGASQIGFVSFANANKATLSDSVFALSGGMVTMNNNAVGMTRYGYVTGVLAASYANIPSGAVQDTFWFVSDKLTGVEGDDAEVLPAFHGGNAEYPTYISAFGMAPSDWLANGMADNKAEFATGSYGFTLVDSDDNPINYLTMDATISAGVLTLTVHKPSGEMFVGTPDFSGEVTGSGGTGSGSVGAGGSTDQTLTVTNAGNSGIGYLTFSFESQVYALTGSYSAYTQYMILSFLSTRPFGTVAGSGSNDYYTYSTVDGSVSRSIGDSIYRVYQVWSGATEMYIQGSNLTIDISAIPSQPLVLNKGKVFNGGATNGIKISVTSSFQNNIAKYTFGGDLDGVKQTYLVVSEFLAVNYGTLTNANITITGTDGGHDISRNATDVLFNAAGMGIDVNESALTGFIYGMLVGVNEGEVSYLGGYSFDRVIELNSDAGSKYNSIFGGMVGAQSGADALISNIGDITFGTSERAGGITMSGNANLVAAGGAVGIAIGGTMQNFSVKLTANSFLSVTGSHNTAAVGGVVGDLRGVLRDITFESEYQSKMMISGTASAGVAALANLAGVINSFSDTVTASIERAKVIGVGYLYNGLDESGTVTTQSINLYTAGVVALGSNYGSVDEESVATMSEGESKTRAQQVISAYGAIIPSKLDSVYVDFEGYVRAKANTYVGLVSASILDGIKSEDGVTASEVNVDFDNLKNIVWQSSCEGDSPWTTNVNYADYTAAFNTNSAIAVLGYAPVTIDSADPDLRGIGMRLWLTNNLYSARLSTADMVTNWTDYGQLSVNVTGSLGWTGAEVYTAYYDESGADMAAKIKQISSLGSLGAAASAIINVDVSSALSAIKGSAQSFPNGIYVIRITYNEVYIYNAQQLMTFMSAGADTTLGLPASDADYNGYAAANIGIIANDLEVNYVTQGTGNKAGHYYATAVTMRADKILEGNGNNVTITTSGDVHSAVIDDKGNTPAGALLSGEYYWDYIGGTNTLSSNDLNQMNTIYSIGIRAGGLFLGRNLGTIQNINFSLPDSVTIDNVDYAKWHDVITQDSWREYGTSLYVGIVTAVNAGTIDNCTLTLGENVKVNSFRKSATGPQLQKGYTNELNYKVNTMAVNGGFAGLMYGTSNDPSYISNCTVTLSDGSEIRATSQASSFSWGGRSDSVYAYAGGVVGWLTSDSTVYNVTINGTGTMTSWGDLDVGSFSSGNKVTSAGSIVGLNSDHATYTISNNPDEFGIVDGVICNWNGAAYFLTTGNNNIFYSSSGRVNYYIGAQLAGVAEQNTLNNIYFMYGIEQYKTFHQDNWYYGDNAAARQASADLLDKYNYIVSRTLQLLESDAFGYEAVYAIAQKSGYEPNLTEIAYKDADGNAVVNLEDKVLDGTTVPAFTFENYANYQSAIDGEVVSGAGNFSIFVAQGTTFYVANQYFPRITATLDSGGNKNLDFVGARAAAMMTSNGTADWNNLFKPNNVYIYEVSFGSSLDEGSELDMNDPDTTAYLSFQTKNVTSDVAINISLSSGSLGAQFVWEIYETWQYQDDPLPSVSNTTYYNNVTSLEQAKANNNFTRIFDRENNGADYTFTYVMGLAVKIAMDTDRYYYNEEEGVFYDSVAKIYDGATIDDPLLYYADEEGNPINMPELGLGSVSASVMSPSYYRDSIDGKTTSKLSGKAQTNQAGAYRIRINFTSEGGENSKVNTTNRTIMFSQFDYLDIYTVVLPKGVAQNGVSVSKTYDGTTDYGASSTVFAGIVSGDSVALTGGTYSTYNAGSGNIFRATYSEFVFRYGVITDGELMIEESSVYLFEGDYDTGNYAPVSIVQTGNITLTEGATDFYTLPAGNYRGTINKKQIWISDVDLDMFGGTFTEGGVNPPVEYDALTTYDTQAFQQGSTILQKTLTLSSDRTQLIMKGYRSTENVGFTITFQESGSGTFETSVKNYGTYRVYLNIVDSDNFILYEENAETTRMYIGQLSITQYEIQTADVTYVISDGYLSKIFDNNGTIPFTFNPSNLRIIAKNGYEVQPDEYTLSVGAMYTTSKGTANKVDAKDAGEYDIYFAISNFNCPLGNYTLEDMTVSFVDSRGNKISYFVLPKEIKISSVTKEFDGSDGAENAVTEYDVGFEPVSGTNDVFGLEYASVDAGANINVTFTGTSVLILNGTRYTVVSVVDGENRGKDNYSVSTVTSGRGNITPVKVTLVSATMIYNNRNYIDYRAEGTQVVIQDDAGNVVNIYPAATFNNKNAGENKTVTFTTTSENIAGKMYNKLNNSTYVSATLPGSGTEYAGNYYVENSVWNNVGVIIKNTLSLDDIRNNVTVMQIKDGGTSVIQGTEYDFEDLSGRSYTYRYGYVVGFEINANATVLEDDRLADHLTVTITNETNSVNGYVGTYTLELTITGTDYDWDDDVSQASRVVNNFRITEQTINVSNLSATLPEYEYTYRSNTTRTSLSPTLVVTDRDGRTITASDGLGYSMSSFTNTNEHFNSRIYSNNSVLDVGDYYFMITPVLSGADAINYFFSGQGYRIDFVMKPYTVTTIRATKEFDNNDTFTTEGNETVFTMTAGDPFTPSGSYSSSTAGANKSLNLDSVQTTIGGVSYRLLKDVSGRVTNNTWNNATGTIERYSVSAAEINSYILGWVKDSAERQTLSIKSSSPQLEYRSDAASGYSGDHFLFEASGMSYGFGASRNAGALVITQGGRTVETLYFSINVTGAGSFTFRAGDPELQVLPAGTYSVTVSLVSSVNFSLDANAGRGSFTVSKQEISGGGASGSANVFITLNSDFSYAYGESGFNLPQVGDAKFTYTMSIIDKYTGKVAATYSEADDVIGLLEYTLAADSADFLTELGGPVYIGGYFVWASELAQDIIVNYSIPEGSRIAVYTAGTAVPEVPDEGEGEEGDQGGESGTVVIPSLAAVPAYFILPRTLVITSVSKTYDGTDSFDGAVLESDALAEDGLTAEMLGGVYASPNANYDSTGTTYIDGNKGSDYLLINVTEVVVNGVTYYTLATGGVTDNYCVTGELDGTVMSVAGAKIMRVAVDPAAVTLTSDTYESVFGADAEPELPDVTANLGGATETVVYTADNVVYKQGGEVVDAPVNVGGYEMYLTDVAFDNYEVTGGMSEVLVNAGRVQPGAEEGGEDASGEQGGDEETGEDQTEEQTEVFTYYIVPAEVKITGVVKFYDKGTELVYGTDGEEGVYADVTVTDAEGNGLTDEDGNPLVLRVQGRFADAGVGKNKDVLADFTPFGYYVNFDQSTVNMYYRLVVVGEDGTTGVAGNYCIAASETAQLPPQFDENYVPEDPDNDDTPVINNAVVYEMTLVGIGTVIPAPLTAEGVSKVYDGTFAVTAGTVSGLLGGDEALTVAKWRYDDKEAGTGKPVLIETDGEAYEYRGVTYYAVYMTSEGEKILAGYGVAASEAAEVEETVIGEDGQEVTETVLYAVINGAGEITPFTLTAANFSGVTVAGMLNTEYDSQRTYTSSEIRATVSALGYGGQAVNTGGRLVVTFGNGDELTFTASLGGGTTAHNAGTYVVSLTLTNAGNYTMTAPYTVSFVISKQHLSAVYVVTGNMTKVYDGTGDLPEYATDGWSVFAVDRQGAAVDVGAFGSIDLSAAKVVFKRFDEEKAEYVYFSPVNVTAEPGYQIFVNGFSLDSDNYTFASADDAAGCVGFDEETNTAQTAYYTITPFAVTLADGAFEGKRFDGAFSLRIEGVHGETVIVGDGKGVNASLAGTYGAIDVNPYVSGVTTSDEALNPDSTADNYVLYYDGAEVTETTALHVTDYTVTRADILVAERDNGVYRIGMSGLQGLDFLFAKTTGVTEEARARITERLFTGEPWTGGSFDSSSDFAFLNKAVSEVFGLYVNNGTDAVTPSVSDRYAFDDFSYVASGDGYVLSFTFAGMNGYDGTTATDRYTFVVRGASDDVTSTNYSTTSSELESGQSTGATAGEGVAVSTAEELVEAIKNNETFYLADNIYGADLSEVTNATFTGTLDGRGHTVSVTGGASVNASVGAAGMLVAVNNGTIKNLTVKLMPNAEISAAKAGGLTGVNNGAVSDVSVEIAADVTFVGATSAGGVTGENAASGVIENVSLTYSASVTASGATYGSIAGNNAGALGKVAVRINESVGADEYSVSAGATGYVAGASTGTADGVIVAIASGGLGGVNALWASGTTTAVNVYAYYDVEGASGTRLSLLDPYTDGYIGYYFAASADYTTDGAAHNELTAAGEYNKSRYADYTAGGEGYVAVEAIAAYNRFIWDGYGVSYRTAFGDGNVGSSLNRIVALFAAGDIAAQFDGTTTVTSGVNAFRVAIGVRGGTVEVEGDVETSVKEVVYTGEVQIYKVNMTVTTGGVSETKELSVGGTEAGYYSKASLEGIIGGGAGGETIGNVTYDSGSRTEYTFSGSGSTVASGIALVIYPKQIDAADVSADKYYDTATAGMLTLTDGEAEAGTLSGNYYDGNGVATSQVAAAESFGFASFGALTKSVLAKDGAFYGIVEKTDDEGATYYEVQPIEVGEGENAVAFTTDTTVGSCGVRDLMIAMSRLVDEARAVEVLDAGQLEGFEFVRVYNLAADVTAGAGNVATVGGSVAIRPVLSGENGANYSLYSAEWTAPADMTVGADESAFAMTENSMTVAGRILPVDLGVSATYKVGTDQSYNFAMLDPVIEAGRNVTVTSEQAAALGISAENYAKLVAEVAAGLTVTMGADFYDALAGEGVLEKRADGKYYAVNAQFAKAMLPGSADAGNFVVTMTDNTVTFRYFATTLKDGEAFYTLTSADDYYKWIDNEAGAADYYAIDMLLTADINFGGSVTDMLAWRDADGNVTGYKGTFDGNGHALEDMIIDREGSAALFERVDEGATVRGLTVADTVVISTGVGSVAGGIAVDNYGTIENCAFEGVLGASSRTGGIAATNYGVVKGGVSVNRAYVGDGGTAEGITSDNADEGVGASGVSDGVSITESVAGRGESAVENTVTESADGSAADVNDEAFVPVISAYVFDERYVKVNGDGKFVTDNFLKLNAVNVLFGWVGASAVTNATATGFYGNLMLG